MIKTFKEPANIEKKNLCNVNRTEFIPPFPSICVCYHLLHRPKSRVHSPRLGSCITSNSVENILSRN